jgi:2-oxoglutarate ferredoxin oxidoreductase subunit gamma
MTGIIEKKSATSGGTHQVLIAGEAGQGVVLQGIILAEAAVAAGAWVAQSARYGAAMRGGEATSDVVISNQPLDFPEVEEPDYVVAISQITYDKFVVKRGTAKVVVYDPFFVKPADLEGVKQIKIPATDSALKTFGDSQASNLIILSALAEVTGLVSMGDMIAAIDRNLAPRFRDTNIRALEMGKEMAIEAGKEA